MDRSNLKACKDCRASPGETCSSRYRLVIVDVLFEKQRHRRKATGRPRILWKNLKWEVVESFRATVSEKLSALKEDMAASNTDQMWNTLAGIIIDVAKESLAVATTKQARFKELFSYRDGNQEDIDMAKERYKAAKREAKIVVAQAKDKAYEDLYKKLNSKEGANDIYKIAKTRERKRRDIGNVRYIKDEGGRSIKMGSNKVVGPDQFPIEAWRVGRRVKQQIIEVGGGTRRQRPTGDLKLPQLGELKLGSRRPEEEGVVVLFGIHRVFVFVFLVACVPLGVFLVAMSLGFAYALFSFDIPEHLPYAQYTGRRSPESSLFTSEFILGVGIGSVYILPPPYPALAGLGMLLLL
nr:cleavage/polyadenylation specificity factor, 25kDa subunit [Tanacetum cinerariifolium]